MKKLENKKYSPAHTIPPSLVIGFLQLSEDESLDLYSVDMGTGRGVEVIGSSWRPLWRTGGWSAAEEIVR